MVVGCNIAGLVINNAAACTTLHQLRAVEEVAHISLVGDTYDSRTNLLGGSYNRCGCPEQGSSRQSAAGSLRFKIRSGYR